MRKLMGLILGAVGRMLVRTERKARGFLWPRRKLKSARIRGATVRRRRAPNIAALIVNALRVGRQSRATAGMRNAPPARRRVRRDSPWNPSLWFPASKNEHFVLV
jgi:hypothetical protein